MKSQERVSVEEKDAWEVCRRCNPSRLRLDARDSSEPRSDSCSDSVFHSVLKKAEAKRGAK